MTLPIFTYGMPVLRKASDDITPDYPNLKELIADMFETMYKSDGVGLAAPQIGLNIRLVVITLDALKDDFPEYANFNKTDAFEEKAEKAQRNNAEGSAKVNG